jgi:hypothetical protein
MFDRPSAIQQGLTAADDLAPRMTSITAATTADATQSEKTPATFEEKQKPLMNVVRYGDKAVPESGTGEGTAATSTQTPVCHR